MAEKIDLYPQLGALPAFTEDGRINIPTQAAADVIAKQGSMFSADPTMRESHSASVSNYLTNTLGMNGREAARLADKLIGGPNSPLFEAGLADITPMGMVYAVDEAARDYSKAKDPLDYVIPTVGLGFGILEAYPLTKAIAKPLRNFLSSFGDKL